MEREVFAILDIGGTKILLLLIHKEGTVLYRKKEYSRDGKGDFDLVDRIGHLIEEAITADNLNLKGIGVCVAGLLQHPEGEVVSAPNLPVSDGYPLHKNLKKRFNVPVWVENDGNAAVLGEVQHGAARGLNNVAYVTISTGIGAGLYLQGELYRGARGFAAEIGHTKVFGSSLCQCGKEGCLEAEASGEAVSRKSTERLKEEGLSYSTREVFTGMRRGNTEATTLIKEAAEKLGLAFANLVTLLDLEAIIVGGGVSAEEEVLFPWIKENMVYYSFNPFANKVEIKKAELEPESGIWGMFSLVTRQES